MGELLEHRKCWWVFGEEKACFFASLVIFGGWVC